MGFIFPDVQVLKRRLKQIKRIYVQTTPVPPPEVKKYAGPSGKLGKAAFEADRMAERAEYLMGGLKRSIFDDAICKGCDGNCAVQVTSLVNRPGGCRLIPCVKDTFLQFDPWSEYAVEYVSAFSSHLFNVDRVI